MAYTVYTTDTFEKELAKLPESDREIIKKMYVQLQEIRMQGNH